jgi:DNA-binding LacI/PurR family transcriptional regulator
MNPANIVDVAKRASVSVATVSRVFNRPDDVSDSTLEAVRMAAKALNYRPSTTARNLRKSRTSSGDGLTQVVGLLIHRNTLLHGDPFAFEILEAVEAALCERGMGIRIIPASPEGHVPVEIASREVDGVISRFASPLVRRISEHIPTVMLDHQDPLVEGYAVVPGYAVGLKTVMSRLFSAGHRKIALLANDLQVSGAHDFWITFPTACLQAYEEHGIPVPPGFCLGATDNPQKGYEIGCRIFADRKAVPDAIIGPDGAMLGLYRAAAERGIRIPDDVSIVGINGLKHGEYLYPPLTTLDVQPALLSATAVRILVDCIGSGTRRQGVEIIPVVLRERASARL